MALRRKKKRGGAVDGQPAFPRRLDRPGKIGLLKTDASDPNTVARGAAQKRLDNEDNPASDQYGYRRGGAVRRAEGGSIGGKTPYRPPIGYPGDNNEGGYRANVEKRTMSSHDDDVLRQMMHQEDLQQLRNEPAGRDYQGNDTIGAKRGGGIHIKPSHKGLLHKQMGVAADKPISTKALERAKSGASPAEKKRIVFAENARKWHHG